MDPITPDEAMKLTESLVTQIEKKNVTIDDIDKKLEAARDERAALIDDLRTLAMLTRPMSPKPKPWQVQAMRAAFSTTVPAHLRTKKETK